MTAKHDFLSAFIGSPARARMLRAFVMNENQTFTIMQASKRTNVTPRESARELLALEKLGIIKKIKTTIPAPTKGKKRAKPEATWALDAGFKHLRPLGSFIREVSPVRYDAVVDTLRRTGKLSTVVLSGSFMGDPSRPADIVLAGDSMNERRLESAVKALETVFGRELRYASFTTPEFRYRLTVQDRLLRDTLDFPHLVLMDRARLL